MTADVCREWRAALAAAALDRLEPTEEPGVRAHLDGCADCRAELAELRAVARVLPAADIDRVVGDAPQPSPALVMRVVDRVADRRARRRHSRRRRGVAAASAAVVAIAASVLAFALVTGDGGPHGTRVVVPGSGEASAVATLTPRATGTHVELRVAGLHRGDWYWLWLDGADRKRVPTATFQGTGSTAAIEGTSALPLRRVRRIWVTDDADHVVLDAWLPLT